MLKPRQWTVLEEEIKTAFKNGKLGQKSIYLFSKDIQKCPQKQSK